MHSFGYERVYISILFQHTHTHTHTRTHIYTHTRGNVQYSISGISHMINVDSRYMAELRFADGLNLYHGKFIGTD